LKAALIQVSDYRLLGASGVIYNYTWNLLLLPLDYDISPFQMVKFSNFNAQA
jgi:hypothetical protein